MHTAVRSNIQNVFKFQVLYINLVDIFSPTYLAPFILLSVMVNDIHKVFKGEEYHESTVHMLSL